MKKILDGQPAEIRFVDEKEENKTVACLQCGQEQEVDQKEMIRGLDGNIGDSDDIEYLYGEDYYEYWPIFKCSKCGQKYNIKVIFDYVIDWEKFDYL